MWRWPRWHRLRRRRRTRTAPRPSRMGRVTSRRPRSITKPSWIATATASDVSAEPAQAVTAPPKRAPSLNAGVFCASQPGFGQPPLSEGKRKIKTENIIRIVQTVLAAAVAAFAISVVVGGHWWETPRPRPRRRSMSRQSASRSSACCEISGTPAMPYGSRGSRWTTA